MPITYLLTALTTSLALLGPKRYLSLSILLSLLVAFLTNILTLKGGAILILFYGAGYTYFNAQYSNQLVKLLTLIGLVIFTFGFTHHVFPGFNNPILLNNVQISSRSSPFSMYFNFDKVMAAIILFTVSRTTSPKPLLTWPAAKTTLLILLLCIVTILLPALLTNYIKLDVKLSPYLAIWAVNNLLLVCFSEELIFRGIIQSELAKILPNKTALLAIPIAAILFGLGHYDGGWLYPILAAICGLFYGYIYYKTNRLVCSMLVHFGLNLVHFIMFTYPNAL